MSRLKILILVLIIGALTVVFIQNKEPVALKLLCNDIESQYCLLQTAKLPLAIWISLFLAGGIFTNLISQVFSRYSYVGVGKRRYSEDQKYTEDKNKNWVDRNSEPDRYAAKSATQIKNNAAKDKKSKINSYEASQKPQEVERSGSNYSYKYRPIDKDKNSQSKTKESSIDLGKDANIASESEDEDWI